MMRIFISFQIFNNKMTWVIKKKIRRKWIVATVCYSTTRYVSTLLLSTFFYTAARGSVFSPSQCKPIQFVTKYENLFIVFLAA